MKRRFLVTVETLNTVVRGKVKPLGKDKLRNLIAWRLGKVRGIKGATVAYAPDPVKAKKAAPKRKPAVKRFVVKNTATKSRGVKKPAARKPVRKAAAKRKPAAKKPARKTARKRRGA